MVVSYLECDDSIETVLIDLFARQQDLFNWERKREVDIVNSSKQSHIITLKCNLLCFEGGMAHGDLASHWDIYYLVWLDSQIQRRLSLGSRVQWEGEIIVWQNLNNVKSNSPGTRLRWELLNIKCDLHLRFLRQCEGNHCFLSSVW